MIITPDKLGNVRQVLEKLGFKYQIFFVNSEDEARKMQDEQIPPPDTIYIYVIKK